MSFILGFAVQDLRVTFGILTLGTVTLSLVRIIIFGFCRRFLSVVGCPACMADVQSTPCEMVTGRESSQYIIV